MTRLGERDPDGVRLALVEPAVRERASVQPHDECAVGGCLGAVQRLVAPDRDVTVPSVCCPDCGASVERSSALRSGDLVECLYCAGHLLRLYEEAGCWSARLAYRVSCSDCDEIITLDADVRAGDTVSCCGQTYLLTFEFDTFAPQEMQAMPDCRSPSLADRYRCAT